LTDGDLPYLTLLIAGKQCSLVGKPDQQSGCIFKPVHYCEEQVNNTV